MIISIALLIVFGVSMLYSTTYTAWGEALLKRQLLWIGGGVILAVFCAEFLDYHILGKHSYLIMGVFILLLSYLALANIIHHADFMNSDIAASFPFVSGLHKGSARWFNFNYFSIQPSEFAKLGIIFFLANYFMRHARNAGEFYRGFIKPLAVVGLVLILILAGGDFSTTAIAGSVVMALSFIGGMRLRYLTILLLGGILLGSVFIYLNPERLSRITSYQNPEEYQEGGSYQLWYSQLALGSGGWTGMGFTDSRLKHFYLPEAHTDFIAAILGEELGFIGILALMILYVLLLLSSFWIGFLAMDREGTMLAAGIGLLFAFHAFINLSVVSGFCPTTGVSAPFLSYGGSNIIASLLGAGILLNISRTTEKEALANEYNSRSEPKREPLYKQKINSA
ncbi:MAG: FtsW/RodA/SpoVE family cell cycle protein [Lentisphaeria bacterium]